MKACVGVEEVPFPEALPMAGKVEVYLDGGIEWFLKALTFFARKDLVDYEEWDCESDGTKRGKWLMPAQAAQGALLVQLITWVKLVEKGFDRFQAGAADAVEEGRLMQHEMLKALIVLTMTKLTKPERQKITCAIALNAHNRDYQEKLVNAKAGTKDHFLWQCAMKCY